MSCDTWSELASYGERLLREDSPERAAAEGHFLECPDCSQRAFLLDPSWAVSRPGGVERPTTAGSFDPREIENLKRDVLEAHRIRAFEGSVERRRFGGRRAIAAAALTILLVGGALWQTMGVRHDSPVVTAEPAAELTAPLVEDDFFTVSRRSAELSLPTVGSIAPAAARVYDFGQEDFALVMVVHETLDL